MGKLFGTDGIRGKAGKYPMNAEMAMRVGRAVARVFKDDKGRSKIVVGKDTRLSGDMFETAIVSGIRSLAGDVYLTGVFPTPGIAFITSSMNASAGIVISASHNPYFDNGIKVFKGDGFKLSDEKETEIEKLVLEDTAGHVSQDKIKTDRVQHIDKAKEKYIAFLKNAIKTEEPLLKLKAVLDCSNG
ncbi:MAG: phosphoglucosamine mutase, partial [Desulfobacterales bacterium]